MQVEGEGVETLERVESLRARLTVTYKGDVILPYLDMCLITLVS